MIRCFSVAMSLATGCVAFLAPALADEPCADPKGALGVSRIDTTFTILEGAGTQ